MSLTVKYSLIFSGFLIALSLLVSAQMVLAADKGVDKATKGLEVTATGGYGALPAETNLPAIIGKVVGAILAFVGVIFFCLILWAGFSWMLAKGNEEEITKAKDTIFSAVLGLIVILGAYAITKLVAIIFTNALTGQ